LSDILDFARCMVAGAIGFVLLWYDWKRDEKAFRRMVQEEIKRALALHGFKRQEAPDSEASPVSPGSA